MKKHHKIFILGSLLLMGLIGTNLAYAGFVTDPIVPCGREGQSDCTLNDLWYIGDKIINFITFNLAIPVAALLFIAAGVIFLISGGNEDKIGLAKSIFYNAVIGLVIIFCAWLLIDTLIKTLANLGTESGQIIWAWNYFPGWNK